MFCQGRFRVTIFTEVRDAGGQNLWELRPAQAMSGKKLTHCFSLMSLLPKHVPVSGANPTWPSRKIAAPPHDLSLFSGSDPNHTPHVHEMLLETGTAFLGRRTRVLASLRLLMLCVCVCCCECGWKVTSTVFASAQPATC